MEESIPSLDASSTTLPTGTETEGSVSAAKGETVFKKPIFIGKIGKTPKKLVGNSKLADPKPSDSNEKHDELLNNRLEALKANELQRSSSESPTRPALNYTEPEWSGFPVSKSENYQFEVIKSGVVIEKFDLMEKKYWVIGRLDTCDIVLAHPTISRFHAIVQYKSKASNDRPEGFYIYDLGSTHGTFVNKNRVKPTLFVPIKVGFQIKFGNSTRNFILQGPDEDAEPESELTVSELKAKRADDLKAKALEQERQELLATEAAQKMKLKEDNQGIDWGMSEDADEETDLSDNPYAMSNNEESFFDDPKKTLRGFFEREGIELEYDVEERGMGQFLCRVELPIDDARGRAVVAEVLTKGKKKEAVVQCALEACRLLDRAGVLRQAQPESRKRKVKNWEDNDFYDSDEDEFYDRSGIIEKKRQNRMKKLGKTEQTVETYDSLMEKEKSLLQKILSIQNDLQKAHNSLQAGDDSTKSNVEEQDALDSFMSNLKNDIPEKNTVNKLTNQLTSLKQEHAHIIKLINVAKPANIPLLVPENRIDQSQESNKKPSKMPMIGKRIKLKPLQFTKPVEEKMDVDVNEMEEFDEDGDSVSNSKDKDKTIERLTSHEDVLSKSVSNQVNITATVNSSVTANVVENTVNDKFDSKVFTDKNEISNDPKAIKKIIGPSLPSRFHDESETNKPTVNENTDVKLKPISSTKLTYSAASSKRENLNSSSENLNQPCGSNTLNKSLSNKSKHSVILPGKKETDSNEDGEKYSTWVPPANQTGDGKTKLNEKYGY